MQQKDSADFHFSSQPRCLVILSLVLDRTKDFLFRLVGIIETIYVKL